MPELPEVETIRRQLGPELIGRRVVEAGSHPSAKFTPARDATGVEFTEDGRRGKFLIFGLDDGRELIIHLGMTGRLAIRSSGRDPSVEEDPDDAYLRAWWLLDDRRLLTYHDVRRFGRIRVVSAGDYSSIPTLHTAGPEPFDETFDSEQFWQRLARSRRPIKVQLLSQRPVAGVGNIYADEALWLAKINPKATRIGKGRAADLLDAIRVVLGRGIENGGTTLRDYRDAEGRSGDNQNALEAYGRVGRPCRRCSNALRSTVIDNRVATWCPHCQRR